MPDPGPFLESSSAVMRRPSASAANGWRNIAKRSKVWAQRAPADRSPLTLDVTAIERLDTFGAWSIETIRRSASSDGVPTTLVGISDENAAILEQRCKEQSSRSLRDGKKRATIADALETTGRGLVVAGEALLSLLAMLGEFILPASSPGFGVRNR